MVDGGGLDPRCQVDALGLLADQRGGPWPDLKCLGRSDGEEV